MRHRLLILIAAMSLMVLIATAIMTIRSAMMIEEVGRGLYSEDSPGPTGWLYGQDHFASFSGRFDYQGFRGRGHSDSNRSSNFEMAQEGWSYSRREPRNFLHTWLTPFEFDRQVSADGWRTDLDIAIAYWPVLVLSGLVAWRSTARLRHLRRLERSGFCRVCGYDLRASPDRCPECGLIAEIVKASSQEVSQIDVPRFSR